MDALIAPVAEVKATGRGGSGSFEAVVSVFKNVDKGGDRMIPGAFAKTLRSPDDGGRGFPPIVWSHLWGVVPIGKTMEAEEVTGFKTEKGSVVDGLYLAGEFFVDSHATAKEVFTAMTEKGGDGLPPLRDWSFGYSATKVLKRGDEGFDPLNKGHIRDLIEVDLYEAGPTLVGMNADAGTVSMKSLERASLGRLLEELKVGARNSTSDKEMLTQIHDLTTELGVDCAKASRATRVPGGQLVAATLFKALGVKGYDDIDSYAIYLLTNMIDAGSSFIIGEEDPADVARMRALLLEIAQMLADEIGEQEPDSGEGVVEMVGALIEDLPDVGTKILTAKTDERKTTLDSAAALLPPLPLPAFAGASSE